MKINYGHGEVEAIISLHTMMVYEQEFHSDIIKDLFGRAVIREEKDDEDVVFAIDYRNTNWTSLVRVLWAALKTADDSLPSFDQWHREVEEIDLWEVQQTIGKEALRQFFRAGASDSE